MLKKVKGRWALVSRKTLRPLAYYKGGGKPSDAWVAKQERRIQAFKHGFSEELVEAAYAGNIGVMELVKFHKQANSEQKRELQKHITNNRHKEAWKLVQSVTGVKLHKSINEERQSPHPDILGKKKGGAGNDGTDDVVKTYSGDTPGQPIPRHIKKFKEYTSK